MQLSTVHYLEQVNFHSKLHNSTFRSVRPWNLSCVFFLVCFLYQTWFQRDNRETYENYYWTLREPNGARFVTRMKKVSAITNMFRIFSPAWPNPLTPNDPYRNRTAPLTSKRYIFYIYSTNIGTKYFKHGIYSQFFFPSKCRSFHNSNVFWFLYYSHFIYLFNKYRYWIF